MPEVCSLIWLALGGAFRSRVSLEAENTILRYQLNVLRRKSLAPGSRTMIAGSLSSCIAGFLLLPRCRCRSRARASLRNRHQGPSSMGFEDEAEQSLGRPCRRTNEISQRNKTCGIDRPGLSYGNFC
jgi:hypothetical protein